MKQLFLESLGLKVGPGVGEMVDISILSAQCIKDEKLHGAQKEKQSKGNPNNIISTEHQQVQSITKQLQVQTYNRTEEID